MTCLSDDLLAWYDRCRRHLPWREDPTPYHVWLSEIMLQQTRVETVKGYYQRFIEALPDIEALAAADEDEYNKLWEGLGYYSRVRNLHRAAVIIMEQYGGEVPSDPEALIRLPGIGDYTCAAIASIAFGKQMPAVDGNLLRIFARMTGYAGMIRTEQAKNDAARWLKEQMCASPAGAARPGDFNQALMDLGAGVCLPNSVPRCGECPWVSRCRTWAMILNGETEPEDLPFPVMPPRKERKAEKKTVFLIRWNGRIVLRRRPETGLLAGLYEFPGAEGHLGAKAAVEVVRALGFEPLRIRRLEDAAHIFTHREWHMRAYEVTADETVPFPETDPVLLTAAADDISRVYPIPSAFEKYRAYILPTLEGRPEQTG